MLVVSARSEEAMRNCIASVGYMCEKVKLDRTCDRYENPI